MAQFRTDTLALDAQTATRHETVMLADDQGRVGEWRPSFTPKSRLRVSDAETNFFSTFQYDKAPSVWDEQTTAGGTATWLPNGRHVRMTVTDPGDEVIRQTKNVMRYIPSRATQVSFAFNFNNGDTGIRRRIGIFDESNGAYLEEDESNEHFVVIRSSISGSVVERRIPQSQWNVDKLDGTGHSQITLDLAKVQMMVIDYEWYGAGHVEFAFIIDNQKITIHDFEHANVVDEPWCATPFMPLRVEITQVNAPSGTYSLEQYSSSQIEEGTSRDIGASRNATTPMGGTQMASAQTWYPIISIRIKSDRLNSVVIPTYFSVCTDDNTLIYYKLVRNANITGESWVSVGADSGIEYDVSATSMVQDSGEDINEGFVPAGSGSGSISLEGQATYQIGRNTLGTVSDVFTLCMASDGTNKTAHGTINWVEQR